MKKNNFKNLKCLSVLVFKCFSVFCVFIFLYSCIFISPVQADIFGDIKDNLGNFNQSAQLPAQRSLGAIIVSIINVILGLLGLIFVIMIIVGGFRYMTAGGNAENTKKATDIIKNAAIGIVIVLLSGAIMNFIFGSIIKAIQ